MFSLHFVYLKRCQIAEKKTTKEPMKLMRILAYFYEYFQLCEVQIKKYKNRNQI